MGKIGDLWVKLGLKSDDYKKGMDNAKKETEGFKGSLGKMKAGALAVWAAIGAAVTKFATDLIASTNRMGDAWAIFTSQSKAAWDTFLSAISAWDFKGFFDRMAEATAAAAEYAKALDSEFEANNSVRLQRAAMEEENRALMVILRDQTKSYDERIQAAKDYLKNVEPLYDQILAQAKRMEDAHLGKWLAGSGLGDTEQVRADLRKFLVEIGKPENAGMLDQLAALSKSNKLLGKAKKGSATEKALTQRVASMREALAGPMSGYGTDLLALFDVYVNMRGDKDTKPLVDAMVAAGTAAGQKNAETTRVQALMSGLIKQQTEEAIRQAAEDAAKSPEALLASVIDDIAADLNTELEDIQIEPLDWEAILGDYDAPLEEFVEKWRYTQEEIAMLNGMLKDAIVSAMGNGLQAITDMMFGLEGADMKSVLAAFIAPFADTMKQMGAMIMSEGIAMMAFKKSFTNPATAIAAGAALMAIGSMVSSGLQALTANPTGGTGYASGASGGAGAQNYESEMTIYVEGRISGADIVLAGSKTINRWKR